MEFRKSTNSDITAILHIIGQAQTYFKEQGIDQWQNNYPNEETIKKDIDAGYGYVLAKDHIIVAVVAVSFDGEKTYDTIYNGQWISQSQYAVIHRLAVGSDYKGQGLSSVVIKNIEEMCQARGVSSIRVDTHEDNKSMQKLLLKNGFQYCGIIYLRDKSARLAFEKILQF
ncbi:MAG TPA: GNAT family N-acetyltransferase [Ruminiclostridium sp.]|jgi:ribosomal protein S18 acetylase RimI-like enzyme|nr:GNAT family N-acetyltransferase [Ruminiclostridium sp.]